MNDLLCDGDNATKVAAVNDKVGGRALRYDARVVDRVDGRDLGDNRRDGKRWQWRWRTGSKTSCRHGKNNEIESGAEGEELAPSSIPYIPVRYLAHRDLKSRRRYWDVWSPSAKSQRCRKALGG